MDDHATVRCAACEQLFEASLPMSRRAFATSGLMFLVEVCPHCAQARSYLRTDYRFPATA